MSSHDYLSRFLSVALDESQYIWVQSVGVPDAPSMVSELPRINLAVGVGNSAKRADCRHRAAATVPYASLLQSILG